MTNGTSSFNFPRVEAAKCACCAQPLSTGFGFAVPFVGTVGPTCVHKFGALAQALSLADGLTVCRADAPATLGAVERVRRSLLVLGYEARMVDNADGSKSLKIGARTRRHASVCVTWEERQAEFIRDLQLAGAQLEAAQPAPVPAPALTEGAIAALSLAARRALAGEHGVRTPSGRPSSSVSLIWAAVRSAQLGEAEAVAEVAAPVLTLSNPVTGLAFVPYLTMGRTAQIEQRHFAQAPAVMVPCEECDGQGRAWYDVGREYDGTPIEARLICEACHGDGQVPTRCPECKREGVALVVSDHGGKDFWCLHCALEAIELGDGYTPEQIVEIRAQAAAAGIFAQPQQHQQPEQQAEATEAASPEEGYQKLAEGLRKLAAGPHKQPEQQQGQRLPARDLPRVDRLLRLRHLAMVSELSAEPCTPERAARARRADRIARAHQAARTQPGRGTGLLLSNALGAGAGRYQQMEQQQAQRADGVTDASLRVLGEIKAERGRQQTQEGWTPEHDDAHTDGALAQAAATYALAAAGAHPGRLLETWPWDLSWFKATDSRRDLIKAGALIVAEVERLDRAVQNGPHPQPERQQVGREIPALQDRSDRLSPERLAYLWQLHSEPNGVWSTRNPGRLIQRLIVELNDAMSEVNDLHQEVVEIHRKVTAYAEALTPSGETKGSYSGEFRMVFEGQDVEGNDTSFERTVPWTTVKEIMAAISHRVGGQS